MQWIPFVMVRITAFFAVGVLTGIYFPSLLPAEQATVFLMILPPVYLVLWILFRRQRAIRLYSGTIGLIVIFLSGYLVVFVRNESRQPHSLSMVTDSIGAFRVRIMGPAEHRERSWRRTGEVQAIKTTNGWQTASGKLLLYWPLTERADTLHYGDVILVRGSPQPIHGPYNPHEFDYRTYLARRNIFHQAYVREGQWLLQSESSDRGPFYYATEARRWTLQVIDQTVRGDREKAIVAAFVIGVTDGIDDELKQAYAAGGAMHALAVSGMHVSILYGVLLFLLKPLARRRSGLWITAGISLLVLWMYGFVTGLTPSILRAVTMFSFVAVAKPLGRATSILNTLAASAFFLLLFDPWLICAAGFQLSYLAVLGIVVLYRPIYNLWESPWLWADWVWQITCVSIAAQVATLPVTLYYFHQFPLWFLLANLFVIPASTLILLGGILLLLLSPIPLLAGWLARLLEGLIWLLNEGLFAVGNLPSSVIQPIPLTFLQSVCLGVMVIASYRLLRTRQFHWVVVLALTALLFSTQDWIPRVECSDRFIVHRIARHSSLEWCSDRRSFALMDSALANDKGLLTYHIYPDRLARRVEDVQIHASASKAGAELFVFRGVRFLCVTSTDFRPVEPLSVDYLVIGNNGIRSLESFRPTLTFGYVILDSSNTPRYEARIMQEAKRLDISCYSVLQDGAFVRVWEKVN